jgi:hypothetical protein
MTRINYLKYSHTDPPFWLNGLLCFFAAIQLLIDLPSVDKEKDENSYKAFGM